MTSLESESLNLSEDNFFPSAYCLYEFILGPDADVKICQNRADDESHGKRKTGSRQIKLFTERIRTHPLSWRRSQTKGVITLVARHISFTVRWIIYSSTISANTIGSLISYAIRHPVSRSSRANAQRMAVFVSRASRFAFEK